MKIVVFGLGYVGATATACLLRDGHTVVGVDVSPDKASKIENGLSPVSEPGLDELLAAGRDAGRLFADTDVQNHLDDADIAMVCVGTPSLAGGGLDLTQVCAVSAELGAALKTRDASREALVVAYRSTMYPGAMEETILPVLIDAAGENPGTRFEAVLNPEFLRESTAIEDYFAPARVVVGERAPGITKRMLGVYDHIDAPFFELPYRTAEMVKLSDNGFHALKVVFANEIGRLALELDVDPEPLIDVFLADTKLNISPYYLRPGGAFGGSCLPKDVRAISALAGVRGVELPVMSNVITSNEAHKRYLADRVMEHLEPGGSVLLIGLTFKAETDDLRESPLIDLAEALVGKGYDLKIYDPDLKNRELVGANLAYVQQRLPHLSRLLVEDVDAAGDVSLVVIGKGVDIDRDGLGKRMPVVDIDRL
ncbi:MAG: GDP-mannose 6-dehydrogenase [Paracoccaceae bacterium]|jgi:GDP-mannose 6-dehydrogenase